MKPRIWPILARAIEDGVRYGVMKAHKESEGPPSEDVIREVVTMAVEAAIAEAFIFEDETVNE